MSLKVELNIKGLDEIETSVKSENTNNTDIRPPTLNAIKTTIETKKYKYKAEDIKLVNSPTRLPKSTYPVRLYVNHDEIDLSNDWGWLGAFRLFCDYCRDVDHDKFLMLGDTKRSLGLCMSRTREDLLVNVYTNVKKIENINGVWFNLDVPSKRDLGVAIFNISEFMGFKYMALEVKKWDNSDFEY